MPGAQTADWVDIYNRLYRERIIFLGQEIDDELANQIIGVMLVSKPARTTAALCWYVGKHWRASPFMVGQGQLYVRSINKEQPYRKCLGVLYKKGME